MDTYEKKYNEALKRAKAAIDVAADKDLVKGVATTIFPELRESEDERIRKGIIKFFSENEVTPIISYEAKQAWLDWLERQTPFVSMNVAPGFDSGSVSVYHESEKQKEQKPEEKSEIPTNPEWSEEDEKMRRNLMSLLANMRGDRITEETYQKYYPWLKSLRPSWKPSDQDELMKLKYAGTSTKLD